MSDLPVPQAELKANSPKYPEAQVAPKAEAKPSTKADLVAQKITDHASGCDCPSCWGIRTGFEIGRTSGLSAGIAAGRSQAAADLRADAQRVRDRGGPPRGAEAVAIVLESCAQQIAAQSKEQA